MQAEFVRLTDEASHRYPISRTALFRLKNENRIRVYGSPAMINCAEFEEAMRLGFPVLGAERDRR